MTGTSKIPQDQIRQEAAAWVVRLSDGTSAQDQVRFEAWRGQSFAHEIAFERELAVWEKLDALRLSAAQEGPEATATIYESTSPPRSRRWQAIAASIAILGMAGAALTTSLAGAPAYATALGERRLVRLEDGSSVDLNTDSQIVVHYSRDHRLVELVRGEAIFHVAHGQRPFLIHAGHARLNTDGSDVSVRLEPSEATITVSNGKVLASAWAADDQMPVTPLKAESEAVWGETGVMVHTVSPEEIGRSLAWVDGGIALDGRTLYEAAAEFNRYNDAKIVVADPVAGRLRMGGYFKVDDVAGFVGALTRAFPVTARTRSDGSIVLANQT